MTKSPASNNSLKKKLVIMVLLVAGGGGVLGWIGWIEFRQQQLAEEQRRQEALLQVQELKKQEFVQNLKSRVESLEGIKNRIKILLDKQSQQGVNIAQGLRDSQRSATSNSNGKGPTRHSEPTSPLSPAPTSKLSELSLALDGYLIWGLGHRKATLQLQLIKDNILFVVVLAILGFGIYLSYIQFQKGDKPEGNLKLGPAGVEITSSILGIFILAFSMGFFYLYLAYVFPIQEIGLQDIVPIPTSSKSTPTSSK